MVKNKLSPLDVDLPQEVDFRSFETFSKCIEEFAKAINEIVNRQKKSQFFAKNKFNISRQQWEIIYDLLVNSSNSNWQNRNPQLTAKYISKNHMVYWDKSLVLLLALLVHWWILWLTEDQVSDFKLELETKIHGIDPIFLHQNFLKHWWRVIRQWLYTDLEFDTFSRRLKSNGWCKIRTRERDTINHWFSEELTWKRKLSSAKNPKRELKKLHRLHDSLETSIDLDGFSDDMKVLFEEPHTIHDHEVLRQILWVLEIFIVSAKTKLRTSWLILLPGSHEAAKLENENIFWARSRITWKIVSPYAELEAPNPQVSREVRRILKIDHLPISTEWTKWTMKYLWAEDQHMEFMLKWLKKMERLIRDNQEFQHLLWRKALGRNIMQGGIFEAYPEKLAA